MPGNRIGGLKAAATNKARYGKDWYARIGRMGGKNGHTGGFAANPELARIAGAKGGKISKRGPAKHPHLTDNDLAIVRNREELRRLKAEIRTLEAEEDWND